MQHIDSYENARPFYSINQEIELDNQNTTINIIDQNPTGQAKAFLTKTVEFLTNLEQTVQKDPEMIKIKIEEANLLEGTNNQAAITINHPNFTIFFDSSNISLTMKNAKPQIEINNPVSISTSIETMINNQNARIIAYHQVNESKDTINQKIQQTQEIFRDLNPFYLENINSFKSYLNQQNPTSPTEDIYINVKFGNYEIHFEKGKVYIELKNQDLSLETQSNQNLTQIINTNQQTIWDKIKSIFK